MTRQQFRALVLWAIVLALGLLWWVGYTSVRQGFLR